ncbi:hypothetical protein CHS0354_037003 [Potamilus streckersoni]|uniref:Uncharacterized protein n=1 Tax=Potamilus streckersoni TaxID=2493646 RepID=A0AAE0SKM7_9BIVA|nr:hypothetical protein CHS0354_037003 [Potamilus streckersoni]
MEVTLLVGQPFDKPQTLLAVSIIPTYWNFSWRESPFRALNRIKDSFDSELLQWSTELQSHVFPCYTLSEEDNIEYGRSSPLAQIEFGYNGSQPSSNEFSL